MLITFAPRGIVQIDDARIIYRNFSGAPSQYNREGDRNFAVVIPDAPFDEDVYAFERGEIEEKDVRKIHEVLIEQGWNVKIKPPREDQDSPFMFLSVKVKFNDRGPNVYLKTGNNINKLGEDTVGMLDDVDIVSVDLDIRPYDWEANGKTGRTAYLHSMQVIQQIDRFAAQYVDEDLDEPEVPWD